MPPERGELLRIALGGPLHRGGLAHAIEHDGEHDDRQAGFHRLAHLERTQGKQHVIAKPARPDHRGDDDHVGRQHDHLVDADHQGRLGRRHQYPPQLLPRRAARHVGEIADFLPIEPATGVECEAAAAAVMPAVGRGCGKTLRDGPTQAVGATGHEATAAVPAETAIPVFHG